MHTESKSRVALCLIASLPLALGCSGSGDQTDGPSTSSGGAITTLGGSAAISTGTGTSQATGGRDVGSSAVGGAKATGGATTTTGGAKATGGATTTTGGNATVGGQTGAGGATSGGTTSVGGKSAGGSWSSGGTTSGVGGKSTGGTSSAGGSASGGQSTGGSSGGDVVKSPGCGKTTTLKGESTRTINVNGTNRSYIIRLPDNYDANHAYRMILSIHCLNGTAAGVASGSPGTNYQYYGLWKLAAGSTIFVAPQGINNSWPSGNVPFLKALIADLENNLCIDTSRVFAEGFSMGGSMSYALACEIPDMIRGVAVHSGGPMSGCNRKDKPVAYFMTHGTKDSVCTYPNYGVPQVNDFASVNGCQAMDIPNTLKPTDTSGKTPVCRDFQGCSAGHPTRACIFVGDHTPSPGGEANTWVPAETWKFITQF
ncbi:MAG: hypothetical protein QM784_01190 [Polyangiaceae bacterium]